MFRKILFVIALAAVSLGLFSFAPASVAHAGTNGQQLVFYVYSGQSSISWLQVTGTNQYGSRVTWSRSFSPSVISYSLNNWWWKGYTQVQWRMANGRTGYCAFYMPVSQASDWKQVGVDRQPGNSCWFS